MAVYTYFGGMGGPWKARRQEGFTRLATKLAAVKMSADPVRDLAALGAAYLSNALESPDLYRVMFDAGFELEDADAADEALHCLVHAVPILAALFISAGDDPDRCRRSVEHGWGKMPSAGSGEPLGKFRGRPKL